MQNGRAEKVFRILADAPCIVYTMSVLSGIATTRQSKTQTGNKQMSNTTAFSGKNYSIEQTEDHQFVLVHPASENETFDSFEELVEAHPICEESRNFFFDRNN